MLGREHVSVGREAEVAQGLILLAFIAGLIALFTTRMRRRLGMPSNGKTWLIVMLIVVVIVLALWNGSGR
jgi:hypothetical protein